MTASKAAPGSPQNARKRRTKKEPKRVWKMNVPKNQSSGSVVPVAAAVAVFFIAILDQDITYFLMNTSMMRRMDSANGLNMKVRDSDITTTTLTTDEVTPGECSMD
ncbi:hypothetical protein ALT_6473 [Aspergillus lentulus]|uniref:Uncharacterized protein n=1 Tax=Aspergillus lentulus TaxID=293939 RepID=A0AAN4PMK5_ASPLE|nr:hypothetical protein CNMCM6936_005749 [Aspergillus lentulus]KAF4179693.1 hypothetical protein CNMCM7927_001800 [Aspergillus lentulus]KAF4199494.1 hypothetical protein CNMCM8927_005265 [Aspergillus lentulus]GAQ09152.1 hypothetical protein ALT_6473 [Aspergillus lentulus]